MTGADLHTVIRSQGRWTDAGDWEPAYQSEEFEVLGALAQTSPRMVIMDPNGPPTPAASWTLTVADEERDLKIASRDDARGGDRVRHGDMLLAVVGSQEFGRSRVYMLIDPGQDPTVIA
jgi:hypothetical protein